MANHSEKKQEANNASEMEKEEALKGLMRGYANVFYYYLLSMGESSPEGQSKEDFVDLIKKTLEFMPTEYDEQKKSVKSLIDKVGEPENLSYHDLAASLGILDATVKIPLYSLRMLAYKEMEKNNPEVAKQYIKTIL